MHGFRTKKRWVYKLKTPLEGKEERSSRGSWTDRTRPLNATARSRAIPLGVFRCSGAGQEAGQNDVMIGVHRTEPHVSAAPNRSRPPTESAQDRSKPPRGAERFHRAHLAAQDHYVRPLKTTVQNRSKPHRPTARTRSKTTARTRTDPPHKPAQDRIPTARVPLLGGRSGSGSKRCHDRGAPRQTARDRLLSPLRTARSRRTGLTGCTVHNSLPKITA